MGEQRDEDCIWKVKVIEPSTRCYNFLQNSEGKGKERKNMQDVRVREGAG